MTEEEIILTSILKCNRIDLYAKKSELSERQVGVLEDIKARRKNHEPLQYILGIWDFMGLELDVNPSVLIPRPETELLVEEALFLLNEHKTDRKIKILDLGTGSGNIAIALAKFFNDSQITAVDVSLEALDVARQNAFKHTVDSSIMFIHEDMINFLKNAVCLPQKFDMIISNPPYVETDQLTGLQEEVRHEPRLALDGGKDGIYFYKNILLNAGEVLKDKGFILFEIADCLLEPICRIVEAFPQFKTQKCVKDYNQFNRILIIQKMDT